MILNKDLENKFEEELDLSSIVAKIWLKKKLLVFITAIFFAGSLLIAVSTKNVYTATCLLVPQTSKSNTSNSISGIAAMAGINIGAFSSGEIISPNIYPKIITNVHYQKELIYTKFQTSKNKDSLTLYDYYGLKEHSSNNIISIFKKVYNWTPFSIYK